MRRVKRQMTLNATGTGMTSQRLLAVVLLLTGSMAPGETRMGPVILGMERQHGLTGELAGKVAVGELQCAACHDGISKEGMKEAPDLSEVGSRLRPEFLKVFLGRSLTGEDQSTMPHGLPHFLGDAEVEESIGHYLTSLKRVAKAEVPVEQGDAARGRVVYESVGCVACHSPIDLAANLGERPGLKLVHVSKKYRKGEMAKFLMDPLAVRASGRMPDMKLTREEARDLEAYLSSGDEEEVVVPTEDQVKLGKENFVKHNCQACHSLEGAEVEMGPALGKMEFLKGCLSEDGGKAPKYADEIRAWLKSERTVSADEAVKVRVTQLNCLACHVRDELGGVSGELDGYFHATEEALGNEARIPPPLTKIGAKLKPEWMNQVLFDGLSVRPYMTTRMPQFGRKALEGLPELFAEVDVLPAVDYAEPDQESRPMMSNGGHLLLGDQGLNCIACHNYNGKESPGLKGLDLMTTFQRLQPGWFDQFMRNPGGHRPGIIMPGFWPDGRAVQTEILEGNTERQLQALWYQFSLGRSARDPSGLKSEPSNLTVTDETRTYRGRSRIAGYRGIAVGFPDGVNYAFNAQNGALTGIWSGNFVSANWQSQGAGDFNPLGRPVELAQDVAFLQLKNDDEPWPLNPTTSKEAPVNPDPLYPRNRGYAFRGYFFDEQGTPTLMYRCGEIAIDDHSSVVEVEGKKVLRRSFKFTSPQEGMVYFRALTGKITADEDFVFRTPDLQLSITASKYLVRPSAVEGEKELLIKLQLPEGATTYSLDYELLR